MAYRLLTSLTVCGGAALVTTLHCSASLSNQTFLYCLSASPRALQRHYTRVSIGAHHRITLCLKAAWWLALTNVSFQLSTQCSTSAIDRVWRDGVGKLLRLRIRCCCLPTTVFP